MADATSKLNILVKVKDEASSSLRQLSNNVSELGGSLNFAGIKAGILAGAMAAAAGATIVSAVKHFEEAEIQTARFEAIIKRLSPSLQVYKDQLIKTADAAMKLGFDNDVAKVSLARLLEVSGDIEKAMFGFQVAMDLARSKNISLEEATNLLVRAWINGGRVLSGYGIEVDETINKFGTWLAVSERIKGEAEGYSKTLRGSIQVLKEYRSEIMEAIGQPFALYIKDVVNQLIAWVDSQGGINALIDKFNTELTIVGGLLTGIVLAGFISVVAAVLATISPFGLIIAILGVIISVLALVSSAWITFGNSIKRIVMEVSQQVKGFFSELRDWIQNNIIAWFDEKIKWIETQINKIRQWVSDVSRAASTLASGVIGGVTGAIKGSRQHGGYIPETGAYLLHKGEYVIPNRLVGAGIGGNNINVYLQGDFFTDSDLAIKFGKALADEIKYQLKL